MSFRNVLPMTGVLMFGAALLAPRPAAAVTSSWIVATGSGTWNTPDNWNNGVPVSAGDAALITNAPPANATLTIDTTVKLGFLRIGPSGFRYNFATGSTIAMDSGGSAHAVIQQTGSLQNYGPDKLIMNSDLDINNNGGGYFNLVNTAISGTHDLYINANGASGTPYIGGANTFIGNVTICSGTLMNSGSVDPFGSVTNGTRVITLYSNAAFRLNGSITLATNRLLVVGAGGGQLNMNGKTLTINRNGQLAGENPLTITTAGTVAVGGTNDSLTGSVLLSNSATLRLAAGGSVDNVPVINVSHSGSVFDVLAKTAGYAMPSNQVLAGVGAVSGLVQVATSTSILHPGSYTLPGPVTAPGILTLAGGVTFSNGGTYAWDLKSLKDNAFAPGTATYSQINVAGGGVNLDGGQLAITFIGIDSPASTNAFWKTDHTWTILTAPTPPVGKLRVVNGVYGSRTFTTRVNGNSLELVYSKRKALLLSVL